MICRYGFTPEGSRKQRLREKQPQPYSRSKQPPPPQQQPQQPQPQPQQVGKPPAPSPPAQTRAALEPGGRLAHHGRGAVEALLALLLRQADWDDEVAPHTCLVLS